ncbi:polymorphic toxin type 15 domain-containing protein [Afifella sp. YEN Y35]|uniref:polymorphic toxin type 15 domain-containing protein n=1 Tax=Afifella sp. YEN Y35 TaxID=3388337 RepID=UPI0039DFE3E4
MTTTGTIAGVGGRVAGGVLGGAIGSVFGPVGLWIGRAVGSRVGGMAAKAAAEALASYMEEANDDAETQTKDKETTEACVDCGDIDCFNPPEGADPEEFRRQLEEQQDTINNMNPDELIRNMDRYKKYGRPASESANRKLVREKYRRNRTKKLERQYELRGEVNAEELAAADVAREMASLAATHALDLFAGGDGSISGLGDKSINSSLGPQWKGKRAAQLRRHAENAKKQGRRMNVNLEECPPDDDVSKSGADENGGTIGAGQGSGQADIPIG